MRIEFEKVSSYSINKFSNTKLEFRQDEISSIILANSNINDLEPCIIATDGNCLFRSVSKALYGTENYHEEIRFRCVFEKKFFKKSFCCYNKETINKMCFKI